MKIVDERENKGVEGDWNVGDVIEVGDEVDTLSLGMIFYDDNGNYWFVSLKTGMTKPTRVYSDNNLNLVIRDIKDSYKIARKVNVELHIKEGE